MLWCVWVNEAVLWCSIMETEAVLYCGVVTGALCAMVTVKVCCVIVT